MKKLSTLLISSTFLLFTAVSCNNNDDNNDPISATGVILQDSATLFLGNTVRLNANVQPADATNRSVTWSSSDPAVATVSNGTIASVSEGTTSIVATTQDGNFTDTTIVVVGTFGCNSDTPLWGNSLGTVSFHTNQTWTISGKGITQIWSDAVTAANCNNRTVFAGGSEENFNADCRSNPDFPGDFFSWCAVVRFADQLCPYPWRVPTTEDFKNLDIAMGGIGDFRTDLDFVNANYVTRWGGRFGGFSLSGGTLLSQASWGHYWSQSEGDATDARSLGLDAGGTINPQGWQYKAHGLTIRCVR